MVILSVKQKIDCDKDVISINMLKFIEIHSKVCF